MQGKHKIVGILNVLLAMIGTITTMTVLEMLIIAIMRFSFLSGIVLHSLFFMTLYVLYVKRYKFIEYRYANVGINVFMCNKNGGFFVSMPYFGKVLC